jgi:hypothetical protein
MKIKTVILLGCFLISALVQANVLERGIKIESNDSPGANYIDVTRASDGSVSSLVYETINQGSLSFTFDQLRSGSVTLRYSGKLPVIQLKLEPDFDLSKGGYVDVQFLYSGLGNKTYKDFRIYIDIGTEVVYRSVPNPDDALSDKNPYTSVFNYLYFYKRTKLGIEVGIDQVKPSLVQSID